MYLLAVGRISFFTVAVCIGSSWALAADRHTHICTEKCTHFPRLHAYHAMKNGVRLGPMQAGPESNTEAALAIATNRPRFLGIHVRPVGNTTERRTVAAGESHWSHLEYGSLALDLIISGVEQVPNFRILLDGQETPLEHLELAGSWTRQEDAWWRTLNWNCPPLGRHTLQLQIELDNGQTLTSAVTSIEIVPPMQPEVVAAGSTLHSLAPVRDGQVVSLFEDQLVVRFAMQPCVGMRLSVDGLAEIRGTPRGPCCYQFEVARHLNIGRHALRFRRIVGDGCSMSSDLSDTLWLQFQPTTGLHTIEAERARRRLSFINAIRNGSQHAASQVQPIEVNALHSVAPLFLPPAPAPFATAPSQSYPSPEPVTAKPVPSKSSAGKPKSTAHLPEKSGRTTNSGSPSPSSNTRPVPAPIPSSQTRADAPARSPAHFVVSQPPQKKRSHASTTDSSTKRPLTGSSSKDSASTGETDGQPLSKQSSPLHVSAYDAAAAAMSIRNQSLASYADSQRIEEALAQAKQMWQDDQIVSRVVFDAPAYFSRKRYGPQGQEDARSGLILTEGMELLSRANGHWELRIPYVPPTAPAKLHLQLQFQTLDGYWRSLTLDPICLDGGNTCSTCESAQSHAVVRRGYSPTLKRELGYFTGIRRRGSVTFGHGFSAVTSEHAF